jgi:hypothetical protein
MGLFPNKWKGACASSPYAVQDSNPDPSNFRIIEERMVGKYLVLLVSYPNCKNFEGKKLMVYKHFKNSKELIKFNLGKLDPHFADRKGSPIARFAPNEKSLILIERMAG